MLTHYELPLSGSVFACLQSLRAMTSAGGTRMPAALELSPTGAPLGKRITTACAIIVAGLATAVMERRCACQAALLGTGRPGAAPAISTNP